MLPPTIHSNVQSSAERRLFEVIRDAPGTDEWACIHSLGLARHGEKRRGEIDFVLLTPEAALVLEVKGGKVERKNGRWIHTDRYGVAHTKNESPFDQASSAMFALERDLRQEFGRDSRLGNVLLGYAVLFPDVEFDSLGVEAERAQVYDRRDATRPFATWIRKLVEHTRGMQNARRNGLDKTELSTLVDHFRGDFELVPSFEVTAEDVNRSLTRLTRQQGATLKFAESQPRLIVEGAAGTGKSMLAVQVARQEAAAGRRTLVLCFNRMLGAKLRHLLREVTNLEVHHAHEFMRDVIAKSALLVDFEAASAEARDQRQKYDVIYPEYAALALADGAVPRFDSLIVDEAQDMLSSPFIEVLEQAVTGGIANGRWRIFLDANDQAAVYGKLDEAAFDRLRRVARTNVLGFNCRNTTQISLATRAIARPRAAAPAHHGGEHVERRWYDDARGMEKQLRAVLHELDERGVPRASISVLYARLPDGFEKLLASVGVQVLTTAHVATLSDTKTGVATHASASSFKGLENDVIVLIGVEKLDDPWWQAVTYVAMSRARVKLYILINSALRPLVEKRLEDVVREEMTEEAS
jgi:hypothetical protein